MEPLCGWMRKVKLGEEVMRFSFDKKTFHHNFLSILLPLSPCFYQFSSYKERLVLILRFRMVIFYCRACVFLSLALFTRKGWEPLSLSTKQKGLGELPKAIVHTFCWSPGVRCVSEWCHLWKTSRCQLSQHRDGTNKTTCATHKLNQFTWSSLFWKMIADF